jgi:hypothetical protein
MKGRPAKAIGQRGSWFANVDGERLPCVHEYFYEKSRYRSPAPENDPQHVALIEAIQATGKVILTKDKVHGDGEGFERLAYIAVFSVDEIVWENNVLTFRFKERLRDLK